MLIYQKPKFIVKTKRDNEGSIFTTLRELPLIKGVSQSRLQQMVGHTPLHFIKYAPGDVIVEAGVECTHLKFIVSGSARVVVESSNGRLSVAQTLTGPQVIAPDYLFGRTNRYPGTVTAIDTVGMMQITKDVYRNMLAADPVFMFNFLNTLSTSAQKGLHGLLEAASGSLEQRIAYWVLGMTQPGSSDIVLSSPSRDINVLLGAGKTAYLAALDNLRQQGVADYDSLRSIRILSRPALIDVMAPDPES